MWNEARTGEGSDAISPVTIAHCGDASNAAAGYWTTSSQAMIH
jgi:hypothetical protein